MAVNDAVVAGGFALAGGAMQQLIVMLNEGRRFRREALAISGVEQHAAFVQLVTAGRRVQRALVDREDFGGSEAAAHRLADELDGLTESAVVVRLIVQDDSLLAAVEAFEEHAKRLGDHPHATEGHLRLTGLIGSIQRFEATGNRRTRGGGPRSRTWGLNR